MTLLEKAPHDDSGENEKEWIYDAPPGDSADEHIEYTIEDEQADDAEDTQPSA